MSEKSAYVSVLTGVAALFLYISTLAPGLTWAHFGADGGDLLAAAVSGGVPHPSGYPLYTLLLQGWIALIDLLAPASDIAWRGNLLSAVFAATSVLITADLSAQVVTRFPLWRISPGTAAGLAGLAWGGAPLFWGQAQITEVYTLHGLLFALLAWIALGERIPSPRWRWTAAGLVLGLGLAHHLTILLLTPALFYWLRGQNHFSFRLGLCALPGLIIGMLFYLRIPLASTGSEIPPVFWGFPADRAGLEWLVGAAAYRRYLGIPSANLLLAKASESAAILLSQITLPGFALALAGLYHLDEARPRLRNFSLLWLFPSVIYTLVYDTVDSRIYLLPVVWLLALCLPYGIGFLGENLEGWKRPNLHLSGLPLIIGIALLILTASRIPNYSLRHEREATTFLQETIDELEPESLVFSSADAETFTLWYGAWASGELLEKAPESVLINVALYDQFQWYRRLIADRHPLLAGTEEASSLSLLYANVGKRPIYFSEVIEPALPHMLEPAGPIWRYRANPSEP